MNGTIGGRMPGIHSFLSVPATRRVLVAILLAGLALSFVLPIPGRSEIADCGLRIADCPDASVSQSAIRNPQSATHGDVAIEGWITDKTNGSPVGAAVVTLSGSGATQTRPDDGG